MNGRFAPHRMALPPPVAPGGHASAGRRVSRAPSATHFVSMVVLAAIAVVMAIALAAAALRAVPTPVAVVLAGLGAAGLMIAGGRRIKDRKRRRDDHPRPSAPDADSRLPDAHLQAARAGDEPRVALGWGALGILSVGLLLLALVVPDTLGVALAAIGLAGLLVFRLAAMHDGWAPHGPIRVKSLGLREALEGDACAGDGASPRTGGTR